MHDLAIAKLAFENCILKAEETGTTLQVVNGLRAAPCPNHNSTPGVGSEKSGGQSGNDVGPKGARGNGDVP